MNNSYYGNPRIDVLEFLSKKINDDINYKNILDIGCASGEFCLNLKETYKIKNLNWTGIEKVKDLPNSKYNYANLGRCIHDDLPDCLDQLENNYFDCIFALDVLEHLIKPENVLEKLKSKIKENGYLIISIPNISHFSIILSLIKQNWIYKESGILDKTHLRFFTPSSFKSFSNKQGWDVLHTYPINSYLGKKKFIFNFIMRLFPKYIINFFTFQHIYKLSYSKK
tara:strand:+ start:211 stop:885 length:675 start_codon:yes stop_codon:yes gene_type:complete